MFCNIFFSFSLCLGGGRGGWHRKHTGCKGCYLDWWDAWFVIHLWCSSPAQSNVPATGTERGFPLRSLSQIPGIGRASLVSTCWGPAAQSRLTPWLCYIITTCNSELLLTMSSCGLTVLRPNTTKQVYQYSDGQSREKRGKVLTLSKELPRGDNLLSPGFQYELILLRNVCMCAQSCPTLCNSMDYSLPIHGSSVHGIFQATILEWVAIPFTRGSSRPCVSCIGRRILYHWATWEALLNVWLWASYRSSLRLSFLPY